MPPPGITAPASVECRRSWIVATAAVVMLAVAQGGPLTVVVGLAAIGDDFGSRAVPSAASAAAFFGTGIGGVLILESMARESAARDAKLRG